MESRLGQSIARGIEKISAIPEGPHESPLCVSAGGVRKVGVSLRIIKNRGWYIVPCRAVVTEKQVATTVDEAPLPQVPRRASVGHQ